MDNLSEPQSLKEAVDEFLAYEKGVRCLSPFSVKGYTNDLLKLESYLGDCSLLSVTTENLRFCIGKLVREKKSPASINRFIAAVRSLFAYCRRLGYIKVNPALEIKTLKNPVRIPRFMSTAEVDALCREPERNELLWTSRDCALFEMLYSSGCRVSEIAGLKLSDFSKDFKNARVLGKGSKERYVFFTDEAVKALRLYLPERKNCIPAEKETDYVFVNRRGGPLSVQGIRWILGRYTSEAGTGKHVNPHAFRHTFATSLLTEGADIRIVQEMLGHSSISTTQRYTHITASRLIETYNRAHPHGRDPGSDDSGRKE